MMMAIHKRRQGFTLIEVLVSTAIFTILMSGLAALFVASLRAVKTGYQAMDANELARGVFDVLERDLAQGHTAREYGSYEQFHGTEFGYSMIGLVRAKRQNATLGRVGDRLAIRRQAAQY